ncbi:MAG: hypothetical protein PHX51_01495 [Clostridia bacterium]|nr:hypothetical protein [Clostridia bacterium]
MILFGTDGVRGKYGDFISEKNAYKLGFASASLFAQTRPLIIIGRDSRVHSESLLDAFAYGACEAGAEIINIGILPSNAVSYATRAFGGALGVMVTASHNAPEYNGFKFFNKYGIKLCQQKESEICVLFDKADANRFVYASFPPVSTARDMYVEYVMNVIGFNMHNLPIDLDCCFGCACHVAGEIYYKCNAKYRAFNNVYDGERINVNCGATYKSFAPRTDNSLGETVLEFAFDGDADRLAVFEHGRLLSGEHLLYCIIKYFNEHGMLNKRIAVGTHLTNAGLERAFAKLQIVLLRSDVGDRNVLDLLLKSGAQVGGESSGHYILPQFAMGSDAIINSLLISKIYSEKGSLYEYSKELILNSTLSESINIYDYSSSKIDRAIVNTYITIAKSKIFDATQNERFLIRKSGTEDLIRLYVESNSDDIKGKMAFIKKTICSNITE